MSGWAMQAFCDECGRHRRRMPFGEADSFWIHGVCPACASREVEFAIARYGWTGRWPWPFGWTRHVGRAS